MYFLKCKRLVASLLFIGVLLFPGTSHAQLLNRLKDKALDKVEDRIERRVDRKMDQALDTVENKIFKDGASSGTNAGTYPGAEGGTYNVNININVNGDTTGAQNLGALMGQMASMAAASYDEEYPFTQMFKAEMSATDQEEKIFVTQYVGENALMMLLDSEESTRIISDFQNKSMLILNDEEKTGTAISMDFLENTMNSFGQSMDDYYSEEALEDLQVFCRETGMTKTVAGYVCKNLVCENDSARYEAWYTEDVSFGFRDKNWGKLSNLFAMNDVMLKMNKIESGMPLEVVYYDKIEKATATFTVTEVNERIEFVFDTKPYAFPANPFEE